MKIDVKNLEFSYGSKKILDRISFSVDDGKMVSILGANGVGKTTLFRCILGILGDYKGEIKLGESDIKKISSKELASLIAYIPQFYYPVFNYSVIDMVLMGTAHQFSMFSSPKEEQIKRAMRALRELNISDYENKSFAKLSGGEQQLVLIARALAQNSKILLMDEPTSSLDFGNQMYVLGKVKELTKKGYTILLSIHNPQHAAMFSDEIMAIHNGKLIVSGKPEDVVSEDLFRKIYNIDTRILKIDGEMIVLPSKKGVV